VGILIEAGEGCETILHVLSEEYVTSSCEVFDYMNLLVVEGFPFTTDEVESHPGADNIRTHLIPYNNSILEPEPPGALQALLQQSGVLQQNVVLVLQFVFCRNNLLTCGTDLFLDALSLVSIM
jgi:hypothetical protein